MSIAQAGSMKTVREHYTNTRAAAQFCADWKSRDSNFISDIINGSGDDLKLGEYIRLCPGDVYDPLLDFMGQYPDVCHEWGECVTACQQSEFGPCLSEDNVGGVYHASLEGLLKLTDFWSQFKKSGIQEQNNGDWALPVELFMLRHNQDPSYVPESGNMEDAVCCDDDNFRMEKFSCLGDASTYDANTNFYYTGRYEADLFEEEYEWKGVPHLMKEADEYLNDMFEDYDQERGRYRDRTQLQIVDTSGDGLPKGSETTCSLNDLVYPSEGEKCETRENFCASNTMRGALTRRHCPNTCIKYVMKQYIFDSAMWSPASYLNCKRWCKDGSNGGGGGGTSEPTTTSTTTPELTTTSTTATTTPEPTTTSTTTTTTPEPTNTSTTTPELTTTSTTATTTPESTTTATKAETSSTTTQGVDGGPTEETTATIAELSTRPISVPTTRPVISTELVTNGEVAELIPCKPECPTKECGCCKENDEELQFLRNEVAQLRNYILKMVEVA